MQLHNKVGEVATGMAFVYAWNVLALLAFLSVAYGIFQVSIHLFAPAHHLYGLLWLVWLTTNLTQLPYAIPLYRSFRRQKRLSAAKGVVLGSLLTAVGYWALVIWFLDFIRYVS